MKHILMIDPAVSAVNIGDEIISESIRKQLGFLLQDSFVTNISSHLPLSRNYKIAIGNCDYKFVCGSNLLMGKLNGRFKQWHIGYQDIDFLRNAIIVGAGWWQYNNEPNLYTKILYQKILSKDFLHSVRDEYTVQMLRKVGIENVINTGCATMWDLTPAHCEEIPKKKSESVVFTLTDYKKAPSHDKELLDILCSSYEKVYFWPQGVGDYLYFKKLQPSPKIIVVDPNLRAYDELLQQEPVDYVGTRLHGGIRALQNKRRSIIIAIDNRAKEKQKDFNLVCVDRGDNHRLKALIKGEFSTEIHIPGDNIALWKSQFIGK
jgi:hypothetical protein